MQHTCNKVTLGRPETSDHAPGRTWWTQALDQARPADLVVGPGQRAKHGQSWNNPAMKQAMLAPAPRSVPVEGEHT